MAPSKEPLPPEAAHLPSAPKSGPRRLGSRTPCSYPYVPYPPPVPQLFLLGCRDDFFIEKRCGYRAKFTGPSSAPDRKLTGFHKRLSASVRPRGRTFRTGPETIPVRNPALPGAVPHPVHPEAQPNRSVSTVRGPGPQDRKSVV